LFGSEDQGLQRRMAQPDQAQRSLQQLYLLLMFVIGGGD